MVEFETSLRPDRLAAVSSRTTMSSRRCGASAKEGDDRRDASTRVFDPSARPEVLGDPRADDRLGCRPHVQLRVELSRHALDDHHGLLQHHQFDPGRHVEQRRDVEQAASAASPWRSDRRCANGSARRSPGCAWAKSSTRWTCGYVARLEMDFRHALVVAPDEAVQDLGEEPALLAAEAAHDAEIDRDDAARFVDEKIPLMHVGVEESVAQARAGGRSGSAPGRARADRGRAPRDGPDRRGGFLRSIPSS